MVWVKSKAAAADKRGLLAPELGQLRRWLLVQPAACAMQSGHKQWQQAYLQVTGGAIALFSGSQQYGCPRKTVHRTPVSCSRPLCTAACEPSKMGRREVLQNSRP